MMYIFACYQQQHHIPLLHHVNGPVRILAAEELLDHGLHFGDSGGASHKQQVMHVLLLDISVSQAFSTRKYSIPRSVLETTSTSCRCPRKENHLNGGCVAMKVRFASSH